MRDFRTLNPIRDVPIKFHPSGNPAETKDKKSVITRGYGEYQGNKAF